MCFLFSRYKPQLVQIAIATDHSLEFPGIRCVVDQYCHDRWFRTIPVLRPVTYNRTVTV